MLTGNDAPAMKVATTLRKTAPRPRHFKLAAREGAIFGQYFLTGIGIMPPGWGPATTSPAAPGRSSSAAGSPRRRR